MPKARNAQKCFSLFYGYKIALLNTPNSLFVAGNGNV